MFLMTLHGHYYYYFIIALLFKHDVANIITLCFCQKKKKQIQKQLRFKGFSNTETQ